ncbi:Lon protease C-terminal proteolytic domain-containing protein, partial [Paraphysoderma sedebokerense]
MEEKLKKVELSPEALKVAERTIKRLKNMQPMHAEYQIHLHHLQWLLALPWNIYTEDSIDLLKAKEELDRDHCGLQKVKSRVLEFLAVRKLALSMENLVENSVQSSQPPSEASSQEAADSTVGETEALDAENSQKQAPSKPPKPYKGPILCFVGPPGVGKTSIAQSIAKATNRKFHRVALGGVRDEAEIRGHRRTYIGALPGVIVTALRSIQTSNPVILLDEVDKLTRDFRGDPAAALLEVLDPEQNHSFTDHFLGVPFDLSHIMWICTANGLDGIPKPLIDRMEIIHLPGYTPAEKIQITQSHLIPKQIRLHHLPGSIVPEFTSDIVSKIIHGYALREAGVRGVEKLIAKICRALVVRLVRLREVNKNSDDAIVKLDWGFIRKVLGPERYHPEIAKELSPGVSIGLAYTGSAGSILYIETTTHPGNGKIHLTGSLGTVMLESVQIALSVLRSHAYRLNLTSTPQSLLFSNRDIHVHFPSGATPKDGPSAGVAIFLALFSNASGKKCRNIGVTGELNLRGQVEPVGGIEEKVGAAKRSGINMVLIPKGNKSE